MVFSQVVLATCVSCCGVELGYKACRGVSLSQTYNSPYQTIITQKHCSVNTPVCMVQMKHKHTIITTMRIYNELNIKESNRFSRTIPERGLYKVDKTVHFEVHVFVQW